VDFVASKLLILYKFPIDLIMPTKSFTIADHSGIRSRAVMGSREGVNKRVFPWVPIEGKYTCAWGTELSYLTPIPKSVFRFSI
jgi:hypothetical protein